ncbi:MAG: alpha/beta hydrolase [Clostridia bacterium]|nr:alpha/beta hydrolase [Clostridia bacterium]
MKEEFNFIGSTKKQIYAVKWIDEKVHKHKGVVQLVHGMQEHIGRYEEFAKVLARCGYIVVGHDHLGHGNTQKEEYGYFAKEQGWDRLVEDIHILQNKIKQQYKELPYIVMGHSMGSLLVRTYVTKYKDEISGIIISGTSGQKRGLLLGRILTKIIILVKGEKYKSRLLEYLITGSFNKKFKPNETKADWTTRDKELVEKYENDPKCGKNFTASAYLDLLKGSYYLTKKKNIQTTPNIPILIFSGDKDPVGEQSKGVIRVYKMLQKVGKDKVTIRLFKDGRHEMLNEINKEEVYYFILNWLDKLTDNI